MVELALCSPADARWEVVPSTLPRKQASLRAGHCVPWGGGGGGGIEKERKQPELEINTEYHELINV